MRATWEDWKWGSSQRHIQCTCVTLCVSAPPPPRGTCMLPMYQNTSSLLLLIFHRKQIVFHTFNKSISFIQSFLAFASIISNICWKKANDIQNYNGSDINNCYNFNKPILKCVSYCNIAIMRWFALNCKFQIQSDLGYPAMSGPAPIQIISDLCWNTQSASSSSRVYTCFNVSSHCYCICNKLSFMKNRCRLKYSWNFKT